MTLKAWNKNTFRRMEHHLQELEDHMEQLEGMLQRDPNQEVEADYLLTKAERDVWEAQEEACLAQKAKKNGFKKVTTTLDFFMPW